MKSQKLSFTVFSFLISLALGKLLGQMTPTFIVQIPVRDGQSLAADVYVPAACASCPAILIQTPYNKNNFRQGLPLGIGTNLNASPYAWVVVDWRGFYGSSQAAVSNPNRGQDGYDVMDWMVAQTWCNGHIGTWGPSALGVIQYQTAKEQHPAHRCAVPLVADPSTTYDSYFMVAFWKRQGFKPSMRLGMAFLPLFWPTFTFLQPGSLPQTKHGTPLLFIFPPYKLVAGMTITLIRC